MAITLEQAKVGMADKVDQQVIDEFRRGSLLLDRMIFDDTVSPGTGGSTLTYGYVRLKTPALAGFREINKEYQAQEADRQAFTATLKIFGGAFEIDRVIAETSGAIDEVGFQLNQKIKAATNLFHYTVINGDSAVDAKAFDGLDKALVGSSTEIGEDAYIDLSDSTAVDTNYKTFMDELDDFLSELDGRPTFLLGNSKLMTKIKAVARRAGYLPHNPKMPLVEKTAAYDSIPLIDLEYYVDANKATIPTVPIVDTRKPNGTDVVTQALQTFTPSRLGLDGFMAQQLPETKSSKPIS